MSRLCVIACLFCAVACGASPTAPTSPVAVAPAPVPLPAPAATVAVVTWGYQLCQGRPDGPSTCHISVTLRNQGPDCTRLAAATVHIETLTGEALADVAFYLPGPMPLKPVETLFLMTDTANLPYTNNTAAVFDLSSTAFRCA